MATSKQTIRSRMRRQRAAVSEPCANAAGAAVARHVAALDEFLIADGLLAYVALTGEVPTGPLIAVAHAAGVPVFLPRTQGEQLEWVPFRAGDPLRPGAFAIDEPLGPPAAALGERPLIVLPLLAFDRRGTRLGRGGGYYDRASLGWPPAATRLGLAYSFQEWPRLPREAWDAPLDLVVTEAGALRCSPVAVAAEGRR